MKAFALLKLSLLLVPVISCNKPNEKLHNDSIEIAFGETSVTYIDTSAIVIEIIDSVGYFDQNFHPENLVYIISQLPESNPLTSIEYKVIYTTREGSSDKVLRAKKMAVQQNITWLKTHPRYTSLFEHLKQDSSFRLNGSLIYSHVLTKVDTQNIFDKNIYNLYKMGYSTNLKEREMAINMLRNIREKIKENKFGTEKNLSEFDQILNQIIDDQKTNQ